MLFFRPRLNILIFLPFKAENIPVNYCWIIASDFSALECVGALIAIQNFPAKNISRITEKNKCIVPEQTTFCYIISPHSVIGNISSNLLSGAKENGMKWNNQPCIL